MLSARVLNSRSNYLKPGGRDTNQANKEMNKVAHYEKSSQQSSENLTKDLADLTRGRNGHKPKHLIFFLLVFLRIKQVVNKLSSLEGS